MTKYAELINGKYREGIENDVDSGRDINAIICGYGATSYVDYMEFKKALGEAEWFMALVKEGKVCGWEKE